jgi:hypothetical protein
MLVSFSLALDEGGIRGCLERLPRVGSAHRTAPAKSDRDQHLEAKVRSRSCTERRRPFWEKFRWRPNAHLTRHGWTAHRTGTGRTGPRLRFGWPPGDWVELLRTARLIHATPGCFLGPVR